MTNRKAGAGRPSGETQVSTSRGGLADSLQGETGAAATASRQPEHEGVHQTAVPAEDKRVQLLPNLHSGEMSRGAVTQRKVLKRGPPRVPLEAER